MLVRRLFIRRLHPNDVFIIHQARKYSSAGTTKMAATDRDYNAAIASLNTLQSNHSIVQAIKQSGRSLNQNAIPEMAEWCRRIGYEPSDFNRLNLIHIAGTKGKGSTSAFISTILNQYSSLPSSPRSLHKIGLYTSPHLRSVRERIQINNEPISETLFAKYFFDVWDRFEASAEKQGLPKSSKPVYFHFLTLMAFHLYLSEGVQTAVIECGIGGEYDTTNIIEKPLVTAITSLDIDHTHMLGESIEEIAWHKAGIFKTGAVVRDAYIAENQPGKSMEVIEKRAQEKCMEAKVIHQHPSIADKSIKLGLAGDFQRVNASLAVAISSAALRHLGVQDIPEPGSEAAIPKEIQTGLEKTVWGGRCETRREKNTTWYIDGGHTLTSIHLGAEWFSTCIKESPTRPPKRVLLFNQQTRDASALARALHKTLSEAAKGNKTTPLFTHAIFTPNVTFAPQQANGNADSQQGRYKADLISINISASDVSALTVQLALAETWRELDPGCHVTVTGSIEVAVSQVRKIASEDEQDAVAFVSGSLHLVGGLLEVLETIPAE